MIAADGTAIYPWNHGETLTAAALNAAIALSSGAASGTTPPANPGTGALWFNPSTGQMSVWNGTQWQALAYVALSGSTMTGPLNLAADPAANMQPVTLQYFDAHAGSGGPFLPLAGGTMTGALMLAADPTAALQAATKQYADKMLPLAGGTVTGNVTIGTTPYGASTIAFNPATSSGMSSGAIMLNKVSGVNDGDSPQINSYVNVDYTGGSGAYFNERLYTAVPNSPGGGVWCFMNQSSFSGNNTSTMGHVGYYGQQVRSSVPASSIGVGAWSAVFELRSQTGLSSATDGIMTSVEIDCFANGADDMTTALGRTNLSLVLGQDNTSGAAVEAAAGITFYMLSGSSGHWKSQIFSAAPYSVAVLDTRNAVPGSGAANAIWVGTNQRIAMDAAGTGGAANVILSSDGTGLALSSRLSFGSRFAASPTDLSQHIALYDTTYGINVQSGQINYVAATSGWHVFMSGSSTTAYFRPNGPVFPNGLTAAANDAAAAAAGVPVGGLYQNNGPVYVRQV